MSLEASLRYQSSNFLRSWHHRLILTRLMEGEASFTELRNLPEELGETRLQQILRQMAVPAIVLLRIEGKERFYRLNELVVPVINDLTSTRSQDSALASSHRSAKIAP